MWQLLWCTLRDLLVISTVTSFLFALAVVTRPLRYFQSKD